MASSKNTELNKRLRRFVYETAAMKGRRIGRSIMLQLRVTEPGEQVGPGVDMQHFKAPKVPLALSDAQNIQGVERASNSFSNERVSPQDTGNFIASIREEDNIDECLQTLSGNIEVNVGTNIQPGDYSTSRKGRSYARLRRAGAPYDKDSYAKRVPWSRSGRYNRNLQQYNNDTIPDNWEENWDKIAQSNIRRLI